MSFLKVILVRLKAIGSNQFGDPYTETSTLTLMNSQE